MMCRHSDEQSDNQTGNGKDVDAVRVRGAVLPQFEIFVLFCLESRSQIAERGGGRDDRMTPVC